jgi:hypothetical protein
MTGLGSIVGTEGFVSLGIGAGVIGPGLLVAIALDVVLRAPYRGLRRCRGHPDRL